MRQSKHIFHILLLLCIHSPVMALDNLDEYEGRKGRRSTNQYFSGANEGNNWVRQPESLTYVDMSTDNEIWVLSSTPNNSNIYYTDISPANPWSADGSRLGFFSNRSVEAFTLAIASQLDGASAPSFVIRSDGSYLRPTLETSMRVWGSTGSLYFIWSPTIPNTFYAFGERLNGLSLDEETLYKNTVSNTSGSYEPLLEFPGTGRLWMHKVISPDGSTVIPTRERVYYPSTVTGTPTIIDPDGWAEHRGQLKDWGGADPFSTKHDMYFPSKDFVLPLFSYDGTSDPSPQPVVYKYNITGSDLDGGPLYNSANTTYTTFNEEEAEPLMSWGNGPYVPFDPDGGGGHGWGHPAFGRWGRVVIFNDGNGYHSPDCVQEWGGPVAWDYINREYLAQEGNLQPDSCPQALINQAAHYVDWSAWSDYFAYADASGPILIGKYNSISANGNWYQVADLHGNQNNSTNYHWTSTHRPAQSPDGTKIALSLNFLTNTPNTGDIAYVVAYNPHPPEIISVSNGIVRFDWRTDQAESRGYTQRGWPSESTDDPPPPRETEKFRLWKSADGSTGWEPVGTVDANIFTKYDFSDGTWNTVKYWEITDPSPSGYYAVTAVEHSGLESQVLSNVYSAAGTQFSEYPANPKGDSNFVTEYNSEYVRYYNIYAADGSAPTAIQQDRIASVPVASGTSYVDWLGDTTGTTQYLVTAVDTQGNESLPLNSTATHKQSPATADGQYTISWSSEYQGGGQTQPGTGRFSTGTGTITIQ